jgi:hypothetical protein
MHASLALGGQSRDFTGLFVALILTLGSTSRKLLPSSVHSSRAPESEQVGRWFRNKTRLLVMIHPYVEMSQGNSLCSYFKQTKMSFFSFYKIRKQEGGMCPAWALVAVGGENVGKGCRR